MGGSRKIVSEEAEGRERAVSGKRSGFTLQAVYGRIQAYLAQLVFAAVGVVVFGAVLFLGLAVDRGRAGYGRDPLPSPR